MNTEAWHRHSTRLRTHAYIGTAAYFITICSKNREALFGEIKNYQMARSEMGDIVQREWLRSAEIRKEISLDEFVVMPDHFHAVVWIDLAEKSGTDLSFRRVKSLGSLIAGFKSKTSKDIAILRDVPGISAWQRNYHDRVIRNEAELNRIREYIRNNLRRWQERHPVTD